MSRGTLGRRYRHQVRVRGHVRLDDYFFKKLKYPLAPLVLALVLGDMAETAFRQSMLLSSGSISIFWSNGLVGSIMLLALVLLLWPLVSKVLDLTRSRRTLGPPAANGPTGTGAGR